MNEMEIENPFFTSNSIPADYFCDRVRETEEIIRILTNGNNLVLKGPRRMGKSGLIRHVFDDPRIKERYNTFYFDIYDTSSLREFTFLLGRAVYQSLASRGKKAVDGFIGMLKSLSGHLAPDPVSGVWGFSFGLQQIERPELTLQEIFTYLEQSDRPCLVAIDEFQQIDEYEEKRVDAKLRTLIQWMNNTKFIFSGSERHMLDILFESEDRPFFRSTRSMTLGPLDEAVYTEFACRMFHEFGRTLDEKAVGALYGTFDGTTYYLQAIMNEAFSRTPKGGSCSVDDGLNALSALIEAYTSQAQDILVRLPQAQKRLLFALAFSGPTEAITSTPYIQQFGLGSASSVQSAARALMGKKIIRRQGKTYSISDYYLSLWITRHYGAVLY